MPFFRGKDILEIGHANNLFKYLSFDIENLQRATYFRNKLACCMTTRYKGSGFDGNKVCIPGPAAYLVALINRLLQNKTRGKVSKKKGNYQLP
jgi:hypothetical protein